MPLVINHAPDEGSVMEVATEAASPTLCLVSPVQQQTSVITVTTTVQVPSTARAIVMPTPTVTSYVTSYVTLSTALAPQSSCNCSDQQQTSASSSSDSDVVTISIPVVVVFVVIILIALAVIGILIWRKTKHRNDEPSYDEVVPKTNVLVENDLYGLVYYGVYI